ncbi:MAG: hypothetical protein COB66_06325 [Coxiella sp. (in: Bacteria)]|nr:MAG: hypothetical protein COB66_06325 [Coxiella sp. (in: g-proteobacteria)]
MAKITPRIQHPDVASEYERFPTHIRTKLLVIRKLIFDVAASIPEVGAIEETLKWGEPSHLTSASKSGSTIRLAWKANQPNQFGIYFNCKTTIVEPIKSLYGNALTYEKNRAVIFADNDESPIAILEHCIGIALIYHLKKAPLK